MSVLLERLPGLIWGKPWSTRLPWRWNQALDRFASTAAYERRPGPSWSFRNDKADATLLFAGDLALHRLQPDDSIERIFGGVKAAFANADFRCVNLETVLTDHDVPSGANGRFLKATPAAIKCLQYLDIDVASVANNHALDFGSTGFAQSMESLHASGIATCGVDAAPDDVGMPGATRHVVNGVRVGMVAATDHFGGVREANAVAPVWFDADAIRSAVRTLNESCDIVVVQLHWGYEYVMHPLKWHRDFTRELVDAGADIVCCHHAHVVMGVERWNHGVIAHGLGNFWFGTQGRGHPASCFGILLRASVNSHGVVGAEVVPVSTSTDLAVHVDDLGVPGFSRLCANLQSDDMVDAVETSRMRVELAAFMRDVMERRATHDVAGLLERQDQLCAPRSTWLLACGAKASNSESRAIASWLQTFRDAPRETILGERLVAPPAVTGLERLTDARSLVGRWP